MNLPEWLNQLRQRQGHLTITDGVILVTGNAAHNWDDYLTINRHQHALTIAAEGTHPHWWAWITGHTDTAPTVEQIPWADDGFACARCGAPAAWVDHQLLPWCDTHHQPDRNPQQVPA